MRIHPTPVHNELHPLVYRSIVALTIWFVLSIWLLFYRGPYVGLNLLVVTVFFLIALAIPLLLARTWRCNRAKDEDAADLVKFSDWAACEFST